jgi:hypothetical protein
MPSAGSISQGMLLEIKPFAGIKVEGAKASKEDDGRSFDPEQAHDSVGYGRGALSGA